MEFKDFIDILPKDFCVEFHVEHFGHSLKQPVYSLFGPEDLIFRCCDFEIFKEIFFKYFA